jgi:hypothetical protein
MVERGRQMGGSGLLYRRGGGAVVAVSVSVAGGVPKRVCRPSMSPLLVLV